MIDVQTLSASTGVDLEIYELIYQIEEKYGYKVHMVIEPIYNNGNDEDPNWWVEFKDIKRALNTLEDVQRFFLEECES